VRSNLPGRLQFATSILPPLPKIRQKSPSKNEVVMPSPGRSTPRPRVRSLIVVLLRSATGRCGLIRLPGHKLRPLSFLPPRPKIRSKSPSKNEGATPSPGCFSPLRKTKAPRHPPAVSAQTLSSYVSLSCFPRSPAHTD